MWEGVIGAVIGAALTWAAGFIVWAVRIPGQIRDHDRQIAERDRDLELWVADEQVRLGRALDRILQELAAVGLLWSGERNWRRAMAKEATLHMYRDQERVAQELVAMLKAREGLVHGWWRRVLRRPFPGLSTPGRVRPVLDYWRERESYDADTWLDVEDPTTRTVARALEDVAERRANEARLREEEQARRSRERRQTTE